MYVTAPGSSAVVLSLPKAATFSAVPHVVVTPTIKLFSLLLDNCNFSTVISHNVNIWYEGHVICDPYEKICSYVYIHTCVCVRACITCTVYIHTAGCQQSSLWGPQSSSDTVKSFQKEFFLISEQRWLLRKRL